MIQRIKTAVSFHHVAIVLMFLMAILYGFHHPVIWSALKKVGLSYYPTLVIADDRYHTAAKINEVYRTGRPSADVSLYEYRGAPPMLPPLPHRIMASLAHALGSVKSAFIAANFIFPPITFFLFYLLFFELTRVKIFSAFFASFILIFPRYLAWFPLLTKYYQAWFITQPFTAQSRLYYNRLDDPLLTAPVLALTLYLVLRSLRRREKITPYFAALAFGLCFYSYFYYYVYISVAMMLMTGVFLIWKRFDLAKIAGIILGGGLLISIPYWLQFAAFLRLPAYQDIAGRIGPERGTHIFLYPTVIFVYVQHLLLAATTFVLLKKKCPEYAGYFVGLLLPVLAVYNFQIVTGFNPQPDHWIKPRQVMVTLSLFFLGFFLLKEYPSFFKKKPVLYAGVVLTILATSFLIFKGVITHDSLLRFATFALAGGAIAGTFSFWMIKKWTQIPLAQYGAALAGIGIVLLFLKGAFIQWNGIEKHTTLSTLLAPEEISYQWLNANTPEGSVVGTPSFLTATLIKHFTRNRIFVPDGFDTVASNREILERFYILNSLLKINPETFGTYFATEKTYPPQDEDHEGISFLFTDQYRAIKRGSIFQNVGQHAPVWPDDLHRAVVEGYADFRTQHSRKNPYRLDYLYYGPREAIFVHDPIVNIPGLEPVYNSQGIKIYRLTSATTSPRDKPTVMP